MIIYSRLYTFKIRNSEAKHVHETLGNYYASHRAFAIINNNENSQGREIGRVFAEYKDKLVIIDGENKKEHEYLIPTASIDHYGDKQVHFNISENSLKEFEI